MAEKEYIEREAAITTYKTFGHLNLRNALEAFEEIPAADVRPVVRGKWTESADNLQATCSVCKTSFPGWRIWPANYCPNCGAIMGGS